MGGKAVWVNLCLRDEETDLEECYCGLQENEQSECFGTQVWSHQVAEVNEDELLIVSCCA